MMQQNYEAVEFGVMMQENYDAVVIIVHRKYIASIVRDAVEFTLQQKYDAVVIIVHRKYIASIVRDAQCRIHVATEI